MHIKETIGVSFAGSVEALPLEDVVDGGSGLIASRCVEIPVVGSNGEVSGILRHTSPRFETRGAAGEPGRVMAIAEVAQFVIQDINNLFAGIGSGLRLLECQNDAAHRKAKMQQAIMRGLLLSRQLLDAARPCAKSIDRFVAGSRLAAIAGTLDLALRPDITVRAEIAPDLWTFNADPVELYFALLNLCRNADDAMPNGGTITIAARNVEPSAGADRAFVEIVVADEGEGMPEEVLAQAFTPYFTTKVAGTGIGLPEVQRFAEGRGGAVGIESGQGAGTLVRLFLPRVHVVGFPNSIVGTEIAYTPSSNGGVFHVFKPATVEPTS